MELIDKDAVIEKINELYSSLREHPGTCGTNYILGFQQMGCIIIDFCNSLKVKEVDLEKGIEVKKELSYEDYARFFKEYPNFPDDWGFDEAWVFAKYFFELGSKAQEREKS